MRLFIAIPIQDVLKRPIIKFQSELKNTGADIRLVEFANIHLTLRFLGETDQASVPGIVKVLDTIASHYHPFEVEIKTAGGFPSPQRPRVVWVGCLETSSPPHLPQIYQEIEKGLSSLRFSPADHPFSPHITIARVKSPKNKEGLVNLLKQNANFLAGKQVVKEVVLFQSQLRPTGPVYTVVHAASFINPPPMGGLHNRT